MLFMHLRVICSNHPPHARVQVEPAFEPRQLFVQSIGVNSAAGAASSAVASPIIVRATSSYSCSSLRMLLTCRVSERVQAVSLDGSLRAFVCRCGAPVLLRRLDVRPLRAHVHSLCHRRTGCAAHSSCACDAWTLLAGACHVAHESQHTHVD